MTARDWLDAHAAEVGGALAGLTAQADRVDRWAGVLAALLPAGGRVLTAGNGGSAAEAQHLAAELVGRFHDDRPAYSAVALTAETATLTALLNDYGADEVFARQVDAHGRPGDVLVLLSTSGRSPNVLRAAERGHARGLTVWALTGPAPNPLADAADEALCLDAASTAGVQAGHLVAVHALCAAFDALLGVGASPLTGRVAPREPGGGPRVVVVGDLLLDRDVDGGTDRLCPDSAAPVLDVATVRERPGGAGLAALLCAASGADVTLVAPVADDAAGRRLRELLAPAVALVALPHVGPTRTKTRVRSHGQTLVRLDDGGPGRPGPGVPADAVRAALTGADAVLVSDYGAGTVRDAGVRGALAEALRTTRTVWDPHPRGGPPLPGATLVTPNAAEARAALGAEAGTPPDALAAALLDAWDARGAAVTAGEQGAYLAAAADVAFLPAPPAVDGDACGAGDRFAATAAVALARGSGLPEAVGAAVAEAAAWVAAGGVAGVLADPAPDGPGPQPDGRAAASSDGHPDPVAALAARLRARGGALVATGGCFDLVHTGHVATLEAARRLGGALVVLLNSDASVRRLKGPDRPVVGAADRARVLEALGCVDAVLVFDEDDPRALLDRLRPDVWVKGADHDGAPLPEAAVVERHGGRVLLLPYLDGRSTTSLIQRTGRSRART